MTTACEHVFVMSRPYRTARELEAHLDRGELDFAVALARVLVRERGRPLTGRCARLLQLAQFRGYAYDDGTATELPT